MKKFELKTTLLNNLEENGRQIIEDSIRKYDGRGYDLVICYNEETGKISNEFIEDEYNFYKEYTILLNFGNCSESDFYQDYIDIHDTLLENGETDIKDFEKWFDEECYLGYNIDTYYEIIENKIEELFPEEDMSKKIIENDELKILLKSIIKEEVKKSEEFSAFWYHSYITEDWEDLYFEIRDSEFEKIGCVFLDISEATENMKDDYDTEDICIKYLRKRNHENFEVYFNNEDIFDDDKDFVNFIKKHTEGKKYIVFVYHNDCPFLYFTNDIDNIVYELESIKINSFQFIRVHNIEYITLDEFNKLIK